MKKILLLSAFSVSILQASQAQVLEFEHNPATLTTSGNASGEYVTVYNTVSNQTEMPVVYEWTLINSSEIPSGWSYNGFCDNSTCYNAGTIIAWETGSPVECSLSGGARSTDFKLQLEIPYAAPAATATFKFRVEVKEGGTQVDTISFIVTKSTTGVEVIPVDDSRVNIYPNPTLDGQVNIYASKELNAQKYIIYNMLGQSVLVDNLNPAVELHTLNIHNLTKGLHFIQLVDADNKVITTRRFIKD